MVMRPTITLIDNPVAVGESQEHPRETMPPAPKAPPAPEPSSTPRRSRAAVPNRQSSPSDQQLAPAQLETNPYAGMRKVQAPVRLFPPLWDHLEELVRELQAEGLEVNKTALLNAILHFHGPADTATGRELVNQWRLLLARPPARPQ
jgi:hypothetical protein